MEEIKVVGEWDGSRLDRCIRALFPDISFQAVQSMLRKKKITLNGRKASGSARLSEGDSIIIHAAFPEKAEGDGKRITGKIKGRFGSIGVEIGILFEDESVLVIDKPSGLIVQPGNRNELGSLLDLLEDYRFEGRQAERVRGDFPYTPVHRLDLQTSGVLIVAKSRPAARLLSRSLREGKIEKTYLAVVESMPPAGSDVISVRLRTTGGRSSKSLVDDSGKETTTFYEVIEKLPGGRALLKICIATGRTHQIRAHMAYIGSPVEGDTLYGSRKKCSGGEGGGRARTGRLMLHAWKTRFPHPGKGIMIEVTAPPPPEFPG